MSLVQILLSTILVLAAAEKPHSFTIIDFWQGKCEEGDESACLKLETGKQNELKLEKLNTLATKFQANIKPEDFLMGKKPNLGKAYPLVIDDYLAAFKQLQDSKPEKFAIDYCAKHFHKYWLDKKFWWPTNSEDKPDWSTIYVYIVDHYHGLCLRQAF